MIIDGCTTSAEGPCRRGFTLVEALLAAVVLAMAVTAILVPFNAGAESERHEAILTGSVFLAGEMMEEILTKPFADPQGESSPGPEPGENSRALFDNTDDYHGYSEAQGEITSAAGGLPGDDAFIYLSRSVSVEYVYVAGQDLGEPPTFARITVTVSHQGKPVVTLNRLVYDL